MKKHLVKKSVALACALTLSLSVIGCSGSGNAGQGKEGYEIWTTYNTTKVLRDVELSGNYVRMEKGIHVKMAKGEGEMGSLYITTGTKGVDKFDFTLCSTNSTSTGSIRQMNRSCRLRR